MDWVTLMASQIITLYSRVEPEKHLSRTLRSGTVQEVNSEVGTVAQKTRGKTRGNVLPLGRGDPA